jgi:hypothetical protein
MQSKQIRRSDWPRHACIPLELSRCDMTREGLEKGLDRLYLKAES